MRYSNLINERVLKKAFQVILKGLFKEGKLAQFNRTVQARRDNPTTELVEFPGFDLFTYDRAEPPYKWFLTKPQVDVVGFMQVYEEFVNRHLGADRNPAKVAAKLYGSASMSIRAFRGDRDASLWLAPATLLVATAQFLGAETESRSDGHVCMRLGPYLLEVTPKGCWSNERRAIYPALTEGIVGDWPTVPFPDTESNHVILTSLKEVSESLPYNLQYAACLMALGLRDGTITDDWVWEKLTSMSADMHRKSGTTPETLNKAAAAVQFCDKLFEANASNLIPKMYQAVVPVLMDSRRFRSRFGPPTAAHPDRRVLPETIAKWRGIIEDDYGRLRYANS